MEGELRVARRPKAHQNALPQQQQDLLHGEMGGVSAAELGDHAEEHDRNGLIVEKGRTCGGGSERVETVESGAELLGSLH